MKIKILFLHARPWQPNITNTVTVKFSTCTKHIKLNIKLKVFSREIQICNLFGHTSLIGELWHFKVGLCSEWWIWAKFLSLLNIGLEGGISSLYFCSWFLSINGFRQSLPYLEDCKYVQSLQTLQNSVMGRVKNPLSVMEDQSFFTCIITINNTSRWIV